MVIVFIFIIIIIILILLFENDNDIENMEPECKQSSAADNSLAGTQNAAEACRKISTKAEEIQATLDGAAKTAKAIGQVFNPFSSLMNPESYKAGDNKSADVTKNIISNTMSDCEITKISKSCSNSVAASQTNSIDAQGCKYCQDKGCDLTNIKQENKMKVQQLCVMQTAINELLKKKNSVDAQALAKVLQKASAPLSGNNTSTTENCNVISNDLSTTKYLEDKSNCVNSIVADQKNEIKACGKATGLMQKNDFSAIQKCMMGSDITSDTSLEGETKVKSSSDVTQDSTGVTPAASAGSLSVCLSFLCASSIAGGVGGYLYLKSTGRI